METKVRIGNQEYEISPLKMKHFRKIAEMLKNNLSPRTASFEDIDKWAPFIFDSIASVNQDFSRETLDEMTISEFNDALAAVINISGIKVVSKGGEMKPATSIISESTEDLPSAVATPIQ